MYSFTEGTPDLKSTTQSAQPGPCYEIEHPEMDGNVVFFPLYEHPDVKITSANRGQPVVFGCGLCNLLTNFSDIISNI